MIKSLKERGASAEAKHAHDAELIFKATARRNKLVGMWAGKEMGLDDDTAATYASAIVIAAVDSAGKGDEAVLKKIMDDFEVKNINHTEEVVIAKMDELIGEALDSLA